MPRGKKNSKRRNPNIKNLVNLNIKREKIPDDSESNNVMNNGFLEDISVEENLAKFGSSWI
jgi:hypothetical protein